jgi:predicted CXXCH cytochrome family protein
MVIATMTFAATSNISSTKHNFSLQPGNSTAEICSYCHTAHPKEKNFVITGGIWNITPSSKTFILYSSPTLGNVSNRSSFTADSMSLMCMACHDGSSLTDPMIVTKTMWSDGDLTKTHPVNFNVKTNKQKRNDNAFDLVYVEGDKYMGKKAGTFPLFKSARGETSIECSSCHSVHDNYYQPFLRSTMSGSALCFGCHNK